MFTLALLGMVNIIEMDDSEGRSIGTSIVVQDSFRLSISVVLCFFLR